MLYLAYGRLTGRKFHYNCGNSPHGFGS